MINEKFKPTKEEKSVGNRLSDRFFEADTEVIFNCAINFISPLNLLSIQYTLVSYSVILLAMH